MAEPRPETEAGAERPAERCWICGAEVLDRNCKLVCLNCGAMRDCSDP